MSACVSRISLTDAGRDIRGSGGHNSEVGYFAIMGIFPEGAGEEDRVGAAAAVTHGTVL